MSVFDSIQKHIVAPSNRSSEGNLWSYRDGNPQIRFQISGEEMVYLMTGTLRLNYELKIGTAVQTSVDPSGILSPNNDKKRSGTGSTAENITLDSKVGALSVIESIQVTNNRNLVLEDIKNYNRMVSAVAKTNEFDNFTTNIMCEMAATGNDQSMQVMSNSRMWVNTKLLCGIFMEGLPLPMGPAQYGTGGLNLVINLAPTPNALYGADAGGSNVSYKIYNPTLSFSTAIPRGKILPKIKQQPFSSVSTYYDVLTSSDQTTMIKTGLTGVVSVQTNFVPTQHIANAVENGLATPPLLNKGTGTTYDTVAPITRVTYMKGGVQFPNKFATDESNIVSVAAGGTFVTRNPTLLQREFLGASKILSNLTRTLGSPATEAAPGSADVAAYSTTSVSGAGALTGVQREIRLRNLGFTRGTLTTGALNNVLAGIGMRCDKLGAGLGSDYSKAPLSFRVESKLDGQSPNSMYTFVLSKQNLLYGSGTIMVKS